jgi:ABC-type transport system involved in multi-copper enzyme maturation permease subunit
MNDSATTLPAAPAALAPGLLRAFGGVWRLTYPDFFRLRRVLVLAGLSAMLFLLTSENVRHEQTSFFFRWTTEFYLTFLLPVVVVLSAAGAMRDDMASVSVDYVLTRPVRRPVFVALRYVSQMLCLQVSSLVPLAALYVAGAIHEVQGLVGMLPYFLFAQALIVLGFSALGSLFGALTARYFPLAIAYGLMVEIGVGQIPTQVSKLSMTHHVLAMLQPLVPDARGAHASESEAAAAFAILIFVGIALAGAIAVFSRREFTGSGAAEK